MRRAIKKKRPKDGWPDQENQKSHRDGELDQVERDYPIGRLIFSF